MVNLTNQMGVPVIVIDGQAIVGFDRPRITELLSSGASHPKAVRFGLKIADAVNPTRGAIIGEVSPGLPGEKAGLKAGDIITEISGSRIGSAADMEEVLKNIQPGNIVTIMFLRSGETRKSEIIV
jgi:S1-C subfamily serine protease